MVARADDRRERADRHPDRQIARRARVSRRPLRLGPPMNAPLVQNQIRQLRLTIDGMTQEKLAKLCDVTRQTIIALEAGRYSPSLELAFKHARALGRTLDEVFQ